MSRSAAESFVVDLLLGTTVCVACGDDLVDGALVATVGDAGADAPWCLGCVREHLWALADEAPVLEERGKA